MIESFDNLVENDGEHQPRWDMLMGKEFFMHHTNVQNFIIR